MGLSRVVVRLDIRGLNDRTQFIPVAMASLLALRPAYILRIILLMAASIIALRDLASSMINFFENYRSVIYDV
jgi:hypothetical protein